MNQNTIMTTENDMADEQETTETESKVPISEEFQREVLELLKEATKPELSFLRDMCSQRETEIYKEEDDKVSTSDYDKVKNPD